MLHVLFSAFDPIDARRDGRHETLSRHLFIDVEREGDAWAIVVRGEDKRILGRTNDPSRAELSYNDAAGDYVRIVVATADSEAEAQRVVSQVIEFYRSSAILSSRIAAVDERSLLALLLTHFGAYAFADGNYTGRRCASILTNRKYVRSLAAQASAPGKVA